MSVLQEPILTQQDNRFVIFPIQHQDIWDKYKEMEQNFWREEEIKLEEDIIDWQDKLNDNERYFIKNVSTAAPFN